MLLSALGYFSNKLLQNWSAMASLLQSEAEELSDEQQQKILVALINATIQKAVDKKLELGVPEGVLKKEHKTKAQEKAIEENQKTFTQDFIDTIPEMLERCKADPVKLENLLEIILALGVKSLVGDREQKVFTIIFACGG